MNNRNDQMFIYHLSDGSTCNTTVDNFVLTDSLESTVAYLAPVSSLEIGNKFVAGYQARDIALGMRVIILPREALWCRSQQDQRRWLSKQTFEELPTVQRIEKLYRADYRLPPAQK